MLLSITQDWGANNIPPLCAGTYSCLLTDGNGCTTTVNNITITQPTPLVLTLSIKTQLTCNNNGDDGLAQATIQGGTQFLYYSWSGGFTNLVTFSINCRIILCVQMEMDVHF